MVNTETKYKITTKPRTTTSYYDCKKQTDHTWFVTVEDNKFVVATTSDESVAITEAVQRYEAGEREVKKNRYAVVLPDGHVATRNSFSTYVAVLACQGEVDPQLRGGELMGARWGTLSWHKSTQAAQKALSSWVNRGSWNKLRILWIDQDRDRK